MDLPQEEKDKNAVVISVKELGRRTNFLGEEEIVKELQGPVGCRFAPTNAQLVTDYLKNKILGHLFPYDCIDTVDVYSKTPNQLPFRYFKCLMEGVWYFYTIRLPNSNLVNNDGYYSVSTVEEIFKDGRLVGSMQIMNYYQGQPSRGTKTNWIMYEFRVNPDIFLANQLNDGIRAKVSI
ncbi:hypothetical protein QYF36_001682 [Acer negundo]|nr:hypothetical protein QYF36_001682 [Acer negundo]